MSTGCPTRTAFTLDGIAQARDARDRSLAVPRVRPRGRGHQARSRGAPRCGSAWPPPPRMRVERAAVQQITAASSVPRAVKDAKLRELVSIAHARGLLADVGGGALQRKVRPLAAHESDAMNAEDGDSEAVRLALGAEKDLDALAKFHGADGEWSARRACGTCAMGSRGGADLVGILAPHGGSSRWRSRPDGSRRARARTSGSNWCGAWAASHASCAASRTRDGIARRRAWGQRSDRRRGRCAHGRAGVRRCIVARRPGAVAVQTPLGRGCLATTAAGSARPPICAHGDGVVMTAEGQRANSRSSGARR